MTFKYDNVFINSSSTTAGKYEANGPFGSLFDKTYNDFYIGCNNWESAEEKMNMDSLQILFKKINKKTTDIDLFISGSLLNQIIPSNYIASKLKIPYLGIYSACATSVEGLIIASNFIESKQIKNSIVTTSSHNNAAEKQFRYPVEYGGVKPKTTTFTTTGSASIYLSNVKSSIKVESSTIGRVIDMGVTDVFNMGAVMAPACADTIYRHLIDTKRDVNYYDLILSGDLGIYGKDILKDYMNKEYGINLTNYDDSASMIFDIKCQDVYAGGSGPVCLPLVTYTYIFDLMKKKKLKKVLLVATGSLHSVQSVNEKMTIPAIAHAISLEVIE
ncbi:MAG: stage V sporulation protein AD [Bacilli bacterium]|nr:stage V sporulation protein AD [Bacilli bacterium]